MGATQAAKYTVGVFWTSLLSAAAIGAKVEADHPVDLVLARQLAVPPDGDVRLRLVILHDELERDLLAAEVHPALLIDLLDRQFRTLQLDRADR